MSGLADSMASRLNELLAVAGLDLVSDEVGGQFAAYLALLLRWNARVNLTAIRDEDGIISRHFVESIACAQCLPVEISTLLDFGSGAGFPGIPIALCRPDISVTLAESQGKKAAFLREALRTLGLPVQVHAARAEVLTSRFDCVVLRAVDRMPEAVQSACSLVAAGGWLAVMTTEAGVTGLAETCGLGFRWREPITLPGAERRILAIAQFVSKAGS